MTKLYTVSFQVWHELNTPNNTNSPNRKKAVRTETRRSVGSAVESGAISEGAGLALIKTIIRLIFRDEGGTTTTRKKNRLTNFNYGIQKKKSEI
jgi:hypothetical protein